ncbi:P-loop NTPase fold protein [Micromonospora chersina]|uniref:P-loop NTPase fold protein n=1 Tax=Micromonospora chersina TaxID=47854 RepID=UPI003723B3AB
MRRVDGSDASLLGLDPLPVALWLLRDRPDDFRQPEDCHRELANETARRRDVLAERLAAELQALRTAQAAAAFWALRRYWLSLSIALVGFGGAVALLIWSSFAPGGYLGWVSLGLLGLGVLASAMAAAEYGAARNRWTALREAARELEEAFGDAVAELLREIILERTPEEKSWGSLFDSQFAPTLVGIGVDQAISSSSYAELVEFIAEHPTSAIGIAGPRGVGKSTLMEKLISGKRGSIGVRISAPKRYEPGALVRLIHGSIAQEILYPGLGLRTIANPTRGRRQLLRQILLGFAFVVAAVAIMFIWSHDQEEQSYSSSAGWRVTTLTVVCIAAAGAWLALAARSLWIGLMSLRSTAGVGFSLVRTPQQELKLLAREEVEYLRYTATAQSKSSARLKMGLLTLSGEDQLSLAEREPTEADSVERLRLFLRTLTRLTGERVLICIDELDKMDKPEDVVAVVNGIKDLFHIRRVHVLVSVSTDAMHSFAARGVVVRDVFDSAFDTVVEVRRLSPVESADLLARRATEFSYPAMYFCHAWSGGHPRDLIRAARGCVTYRARAGAPVPLATVVDAVLFSDVLALLRATTEKLHADPETADLVSEVLAFRDLLQEEQGPLHTRIRSALDVADLPVIAGPVTEASLMVQTLLPYLRLAALVSELFGVSRVPKEWKDSAVEKAVQYLTSAQAAMAGHPIEAARAVERAQAAVAIACPTSVAN